MVKVNEKIEEELQAIFSGEVPWITIVWDDPVNLMTYVTYVLMELFGFSKDKATEQSASITTVMILWLQWWVLLRMTHLQKMKFCYDFYQMHMQIRLMLQSFEDTQNQL